MNPPTNNPRSRRRIYVKKMGVRQFVLFARRRTGYGIPPHVTRCVMLAWRDWMVNNLSEGHHVYQEHVGTFKLTKRIIKRRDRTITDHNGIVHQITLPPSDVYITFKAAAKLRKAIKLKFNPPIVPNDHENATDPTTQTP